MRPSIPLTMAIADSERCVPRVKTLLLDLQKWVHRPLNKTRGDVNRRAWVTSVALKIVRGPRYARKTEEERLSYWADGRWPKPKRQIGAEDVA